MDPPLEAEHVIAVEDDDVFNDDNYIYLVEAEWFAKWAKYTGFHNPDDTEDELTERPGPLDNSILLDKDAANNNEELRGGLRENLDYVVVKEMTYALLHAWYGGGPELLRPIVQTPDGPKVIVYPVRLKVVCSTNMDRAKEILASKTGTVRELKEQACHALRVDPADFKLWDFYNNTKYQCLEDLPDSTLEQCRIFNNQTLLLDDRDEHMDGGKGDAFIGGPHEPELIGYLQVQLTQLKEENARLNEELLAKESTINELSSRLSAVQEGGQTDPQDVTLMESRVHELEQLLSQQRVNRDMLKSRISELEASLAGRGMPTETPADVAALKARVAELEGIAAAAQEAAEKLRGRVEELEELLSRAGDSGAFRLQVATLEAQLHEKAHEADMLQHKVAGLSAQAEEASAARERASELVLLLEATEGDANEWRRKAAELDAALAERSAAAAALAANVRELEALLAAKGDTDALKLKMAEMEELLAQKRGANEKLVSKVAELEAELADRHALKAGLAAAEAQLADKGAEAAQLKGLVAELQELAESRSDRDVLQSRVSELEAVLAQKVGAADKLRARLAELESAARSAQDAEALSAHAAALAEDLDKTRGELRASQDSVRRLEAQLVGKTTEMEKLKEKVLNVESLLAQSSGHTQRFKARAGELQAQLAERAAALEALAPLSWRRCWRRGSWRCTRTSPGCLYWRRR